MILLPLNLAICFLTVVGAGDDREKARSGTEASQSLEQRQADPAITPILKSTDVDVAAPAATASAAPDIFLDWYSVNGGGAHNVASASYKLGLSVGQAAAGAVSGATFSLGIGFWYGVAGGSCPIVETGDVNLSGAITSADIIYLVGYVFRSLAVPKPCEASGDVNCSDKVTSADIIYLVNHVFRSGPLPCDACTSLLASAC